MDTHADIESIAGEADLVRRRLTVADFHRMGEVGILGERERVELIEGQLIQMAPIGSEHSGKVNRLNRLLVMAVGHRGVVATQNPVQLSDITEPQPDFAVLKPRDDDYQSATPNTADVLLLVEVASSSLNYDRRLKRALYARHGIPEYWLVNVSAGVVEVYRDPVDGAYTSSATVGSDGTLDIVGLPGVTIPGAALFG